MQTSKDLLVSLVFPQKTSNQCAQLYRMFGLALWTELPDGAEEPPEDRAPPGGPSLASKPSGGELLRHGRRSYFNAAWQRSTCHRCSDF